MLLLVLLDLLSTAHSAPSFLHGSDFCIANDETWVVDNIWKYSLDILGRVNNDPAQIKVFFMSQLKIASDLNISVEERGDKLKNSWQEEQREHPEEEETLAHFRPNLFLSLVRLIKGYCLCNRLGLPEATDSFYNIIFEEEFIQADRELKRHLITKNIRSFTVNNE